MIEASFGDVSMSVRTAHLKWESKALVATPTRGTVHFSWEDQGWGNQKGEIFLLLMSPSGEEKASYKLTDHVAPHKWEDIKVQLVATDPILAQATAGCWYQVKADAWKGGGHELYIKDFVLSVGGPGPRHVEHSFGDASIALTYTQLKWQSEALQAAPVSGTLQCRWKDQGWGNQKGKIYLKLMAPDGAEKACFPLTDHVSPHAWEDVKIDLVATNPVIAQATAGCTYHFMADEGEGGGHEIYVEGIVLQIEEPPVPNQIIEASFGDVSMAVRTAHLKWESKPLEMTPCGGTVQFSWKDQGWGNQRGETFLLLMSSSGEEKASYKLADHVAPHKWEDIKVKMVGTDPILAQATAGCWYQIKADAWSGGGHELYIRDFVLSLVGPGAKHVEQSFGDASIALTHVQLKWQYKAVQAAPVSGSLQCRWKDQGWGNQRGRIYLKLMAPDGDEKAFFPLTDHVSPHAWEDVKVNFVATDPVIAQATAGCTYHFMADEGNGNGHEIYVEGIVLRIEVDGGEILEPQGTHHEWGSQAPLAEVGQWIGTPGAYFNTLKAAHGGAPVYKAHPGLACIAITDHAGGEWFFNQPETVLDRFDGAAIGPFKLATEYVGDTVPALVSNMSESHAAVRDYTTDVLRERLGSTQTALTHASDKFYKNLKENGLGEYTNVYDTFLQQAGPFMLEWVFGTGEEGGQALPPFKDYLKANPELVGVLFKLQIDTMDLSIPEASQEEKDSIDVLLNSILDSKMWPKYAEMLAQNNVPIKSLERTFMFNTSFQSASAIAKNMVSALGALTAHPDFAEDLRKELDGQDLTIRSVLDVAKFPLLDSLHWEILRMFPAPPFYFKNAKKDLLIPTSTGQRYQVRKGDLLYCHQPLVGIDELRFGSDAREFKPRRFVGNHGLKKDVFAYTFGDHAKPQRVEGKPWGCIAHTVGVLDGVLKVFYGRFVQEATFELTETPVIDPDLSLGTVGPGNMTLAKITLRK